MKQLIVAITAIALLVVPATAAAADGVKPKRGTYEGDITQPGFTVGGGPVPPTHIEFTLKKKKVEGEFVYLVDCADSYDPVGVDFAFDFRRFETTKLRGRKFVAIEEEEQFGSRISTYATAKWKTKKKAKGFVASGMDVFPGVRVWDERVPPGGLNQGDCVYHVGEQTEGPYTLDSGKLPFVARRVSS